ncbi:porin [Janthinobacterium aquaticum]|uniref:porin n=1 Tax=Janthinobacterium sp. FT58W TaxID=2654254 RepID=UPI001264E4D6|nr:porin [Janthinobacterium sp. FT58W]KAB8043915.1 porin [Janthinobacterium sp. FT58W]
MKKQYGLAGAVLSAIAGMASAQSNVVIYGIADAGITHESGGAAGSLTKVNSGAASASRIGFKGTEELGGGLSAIFLLESGYKIDTGDIDAAGTLFNRQAYVGLKSTAGTMTLGRQYTPYHSTLASVADPFGTGLAGTSKNLFPDSGANVRSSNTVLYASPVANGVSGELAYSFGEKSSTSTGRQFGGAIGYAQGPLTVRLAYNSKNGDVETAPGITVHNGTGRNTLLAANYDFKVVKLFAAYGVDKGFNSAPLGNANNPYGGVRPTASTDGNEILLGFTAPVGGGSLIASVMRKDDKTAFNQDARSWGVGYIYPLSKRTSLYGAYAAIHNRNGAGYTVANNSESGSGNRGMNLGVRHSF